MPFVQGKFDGDSAGIVDLEFPSTDNVVVQQLLVDENESVGVLSRIRGWLGKE